MSPQDDELYFRREQSQIKHSILDKYLERFARIVGKRWDGILYVDGFSGPWNINGDDFRDSSFDIALRQLRSARDTVRKTFQKDLKIKCIFLEKDAAAFSQLQNYAKQQTDVEVIPLNRDFEQAVPELERMIRKESQGFFPFIFIDPTGWAGFSMKLIAPLIQIRPCEVIINFMTSFIQRFINDERAGIEASFKKLFGDDFYKQEIDGREGLDREDAIVFTYAKRIAEVGGFDHVPITVVLHPTKDKSHFHLVYAMRNIAGLKVFKEAEQHALKLSEQVRADAKRRAREASSGQSELFGGREIPETIYASELLEHYESLARSSVHELIRDKKEVSYNNVYAIGMQFPMVQEKSLRSWITEIADVINLSPMKKVPKLNSEHRIRFRQI
ncbi:MAG TPA: three-Cys-motif partner protein TcmP [Chthoniobacterales bacterium]